VQGKAVAELADRLGWPLLADLQSQIRFDDRNLVHTDLALQHSDFVAELARAEVLLQFGARLISKRSASSSNNTPGRILAHRTRSRHASTPTTGCAAAWCATRRLCGRPSNPPFAAALAPVGARQQAISQQIRTACDRFSELGCATA
jgi:2-succinyl-5-enolpyruvyl-6-hydroxy-3-cyclohexene-1-carboxylate synthase